MSPTCSSTAPAWGPAPTTFTNVQANHTINASFAVDSGQTYTITPSAGANGSITPPLPQSIAAGGSVSFSIAAEAGYHIADVLVDGTTVGAVASYTFTNVQADHAISASFAATMGPVVMVTSPTGGEVWRRGTAQAIRWTLSAPVAPAASRCGRPPAAASRGSRRRDRRWRRSPTAQLPWTYTVALPAGGTYQILVRYESDAGTVLSEARSSGTVEVPAQTGSP